MYDDLYDIFGGQQMTIEEPGPTKKLIVEVPRDLHQKFKMMAYGEGRTIKDIIIEVLKIYTENEKNDKSKGKK